jgi:hypothetical protein
VVSEATPH